LSRKIPAAGVDLVSKTGSALRQIGTLVMAMTPHVEAIAASST
jgi:methyl-accepting chemotaxis protein